MHDGGRVACHDELSADGLTRAVDAALMELESHDENKVPAISKQIYTVLAAILDGEALSIIMNIPGRNGFEAWRKLNKRFDPQTAGRRKHAMSTILNVKSVSLKELPASIERCEKYVREYEEANKTTLTDDVKTATLTDMCPSNLSQHNKLHYNRSVSYTHLTLPTKA